MNTSTNAVAAVLDPVCGMTIDPAMAAGSSNVNGETTHFCSQTCKTMFDAEPKKYSEAAEPSSCCSGHSCHTR
jgi:Cu+-exporting ATPase